MDLGKIEFRGLNKKGRWVYGYVVFQMDEWLICNTDEVPPSMQDPCGDTRFWKETVDPKTIGQSICIKDKNGNKVYAGDNILIHWRTCESSVETISYDEQYGYWKYGNNPICELMEHPIRPFEVIGNIHQN